MNTNECRSCQAEATWKATGEWASDAERNHWTLFGCTCEPGSAAAAAAFIKTVTR